MTEADDLTALRSAVEVLNKDEKLALAGKLALDCTVQFRWSVIRGNELLGKDLPKIALLLERFSKTAKLAFAIELLQFCQDEEEDEGDGLPDPSDYEDEEYYSSGRPLLGGYDPNVDIDALSGFHRGCDDG